MQNIDWNLIETKAAGMTTEGLHYALLDISKVLDLADRMDRELGGDRGGRYRDEASVYRRELARRRGAA